MVSLLNGKKVLVSGGCGFIGSHIVDRLLNAGAKVSIIDNLSTGSIDNIEHCLDKVDFFEGDIRDIDLLDKVLEGIELVSHQAAMRSVPKSVDDPLSFHEVNVSGSLNLFLKARDKGIKRIVCASSSSVYGNRKEFPEKEEDMVSPLSPYAASKLFMEHYGSVFSRLYEMEIISLRYFNVFGPRQSLENKYAVVVPKFISCLLKNESPPIYGDGTQERDFTFVTDVAEANIAALAASRAGGEVFNIAGGRPYSVNCLFETLKKMIGAECEPGYKPERKGDVKKTCADISKSESLLGWDPVVTLAQGLDQTVKYFKEKIITE